MKAKFKTTCPECKEDVKPGQEIVKHEGKWVQKICVPEEAFP